MPEVLVIMGSKSDLPVAEKAADIFKKFGISYDFKVASAHRTPKKVEDLVKGSDAKIFIAIAGLSAALPGPQNLSLSMFPLFPQVFAMK